MDGKAFKDTLKNFGSYEEKKQFSKEDKTPKSYADMSDEELDKSTEKLLEDIFEGKKPEEPKYSHFGDYDILDYDDFINNNEGLAGAINARGGKATKDVLLGFFKKPNNLSSYEKDGKVYLQQDDDNLSDVLEISPEDLSAIEEAAKRYAASGSEPEGKTVEKTTVKVTGDDDAKKVSEKAASDDVMPAEEFDKLIGKKPGEGDEKLDDDVEAVMDMVYKLPPEKAKKIMDRLSGLNLGNVPSDKNVKKEC